MPVGVEQSLKEADVVCWHEVPLGNGKYRIGWNPQLNIDVDQKRPGAARSPIDQPRDRPDAWELRHPGVLWWWTTGTALTALSKVEQLVGHFDSSEDSPADSIMRVWAMHEKATHWTGAAMAELKEAIHSFIDDANGNPQPLMGTKDPGQHHRCRQTRAPTVRFDPLGLVVNYVGAFVYQLLGTQNLQSDWAGDRLRRLDASCSGELLACLRAASWDDLRALRGVMVWLSDDPQPALATAVAFGTSVLRPYGNHAARSKRGLRS
jgi:hypothetical protein